MKKFLSCLTILGLMAGFSAHATFPPDAVNQALLKRANVFDPLPGIGDRVNQNKNLIRYTYDFAVLGSPAAGSTFLVDDQGNQTSLPLGAIVTNVTANIITQPLPSTTSISLGLKAGQTADLMALKTQAQLTVGFLAGVPVGTAATWVGPTVYAGSAIQGGTPFMNFTTGSALTAGKIEWFVEYVIQ